MIATPTQPRGEIVAEAFDLGRPTVPMALHRYGSAETWRLDTGHGAFLVKRLWPGADPPWRPVVEHAMEFERRAGHVGVATPRAVQPRRPAFGCAARIDGHGVFRAYQWLDHRTLSRTDDVTDWLGVMMARLHRLEPLAERPEPLAYGVHPREVWEDCLAEGEAQGRAWAALLRTRLPFLLETSDWIADTFAAADDYVVTHRDVEPWNVLMTGDGPVLVDWDTAGPDSASLEAAHATLVFAARGRTEPDPGDVRRTMDAYVREGGRPLPTAGPGDLLVRRLGLRIVRMLERLQITLGRIPAGSTDPDQAETRAGEQLAGLPEFALRLRRWSGLFGPQGSQ